VNLNCGSDDFLRESAFEKMHGLHDWFCSEARTHRSSVYSVSPW